MSFIGLTFVGVGPGDPSLLTIASIQAIKASTIIAYPVSEGNVDGIAANIASDWFSDTQVKLPLKFPMVSEPEPLLKAWGIAAEKLASLVERGEQVVFLCEGDVSLFASSSYLLKCLQSSHSGCPIRLIPGVTSISAAAALGAYPLALQNDQLLVVPAPEDSETLEALLDEAASKRRVLVIIKLGHRWAWVRPLLNKKGLLNKTLFAERIGFTDEKVTSAIHVEESPRPYFSLLIIRQSWPEIMP
ncbi:precorrin-2 C(20)-methyltransferase [Prochlorococcus sp. MIT 1341]|uniref:precorrin-2 C(20)-methyltransferase n=1 Tax=Prochlorococcus sp. MIT 1341 TaxID=3096221 RepID=UPI002A7624CF|nr:precorrin-2 C(20)-methyltransferase [Prochlorococcus sp. MIT 1341]